MSEPSKPPRKKPPRPALSAREIKFCSHYFEHGVATEAYRAAGYPIRPADSVKVLAWRVLRKPAVRDYIHELRQEACDAAKVTVNRLAQGLARIAFADRGDLFDEHGRLLPPGQWPKDIAGTIEGIESEDLFEVTSEPGKAKRKELVGYARKVKTARRAEAIKLLMQWRDMIRDASEEEFAREIERLRALLEETQRGNGT